MRNLILDYTIVDGHTIRLDKFAKIDVPQIRLIVNETQKVVLCSSMQKNLVSCTGNDNLITTDADLPAIVAGDAITIEVDTGSDVVYEGGTDWYLEAKNHKALGDFVPFIITQEMGAQLSTIAEKSAIKSFFEGLYCKSADLSAWTQVYGGSQSAQFLFKNCTMLESLDFSGLKKVVDYGLQEFAQGCTALRSVDLSALENLETAGFYSAFQNCNNLVTMRLSCYGASFNSAQNPLNSAQNITDLTLVGTPTDNLYLSWQPSLSYDSVKGVLTLLAASPVSGKSCNFYSGDLHITDQGGELTALATAATANGWTINHLSID